MLMIIEINVDDHHDHEDDVDLTIFLTICFTPSKDDNNDFIL